MIVPYGHIVGNSTGGTPEDSATLLANPELPLVSAFGRTMVVLFSDNTLEEVGRFVFENFTVDSRVLACAWKPDGSKLVINSSDEEMTVFDLSKTEGSSYSIPLIGFLLPASSSTIVYQLYPRSSFRSKTGPVRAIHASERKIFVAGASGQIGVFSWSSRHLATVDVGLPAVQQLFVHPKEELLFAHGEDQRVLAVLPTGEAQTPWASARSEPLLDAVPCLHVNFASGVLTASREDKAICLFSYVVKESILLSPTTTFSGGALSDMVGEIASVQWDPLGNLLFVGFSDYRFLVYTVDKELLYSNGKDELEQAQSATWSSNFLFVSHRNEIRLIPTVRYPRITYFEPDMELSLLARRTVMVFKQTEWFIHRIPDSLLDAQSKFHATSKSFLAMSTATVVYLYSHADTTWEEMDLGGWEILGLSFYMDQYLVVLRDNGEVSQIALYDVSLEDMSSDAVVTAALLCFPLSDIRMFDNYCCVLGEDRNAYIFEIKETQRGQQFVPHTPIPVPPCYAALPLVHEGRVFLIVLSINDQILLVDARNPQEVTPIVKDVKNVYLVSMEPYLPAPHHYVALITTAAGSFVWFPMADPDGSCLNEKPIHVAESDRQLLGLYTDDHQFVYSHCVTNPDEQGQLFIDLYTSYRSYLSDVAFVLLTNYPTLFGSFVDALLENEEYLTDFLPQCLHSLFLYFYDSLERVRPALEMLKKLGATHPQVPLSMIESLRLVDIAHHPLIFSYIGPPASLFALAKENEDLYACKICVPLLECSAISGQTGEVDDALVIQLYDEEFQFPAVACASLQAAVYVYCHAIQEVDLETISEAHQFIEKEVIRHRSPESKKALGALDHLQEIDQTLLNSSFKNHDYMRSLAFLQLRLLSLPEGLQVTKENAKTILNKIKKSFVVETSTTTTTTTTESESGEEKKVISPVLDTYNLQLFYNALVDHEATDYALLCAILLRNKQDCLSLKEKHPDLYALLLT